MIIFLYGPDTYRSRQKLGEIVRHYKEVHKSGLNLKSFDGDNLNYQDFKDEFKQMPMFQEKKLLILKNIFCEGIPIISVNLRATAWQITG